MQMIKIAIITILIITVVPIYSVYGQSATYGLASTYDVPSYEQTYINNLLSWINNAAKYGVDGTDYVLIINGATRSDIYSVASTDYNPAHVFFVGHGGRTNDDGHTRLYIVEQNGWSIYDDDIYQYTSSRHVHLAFLYSCYQSYIMGDIYDHCICIPYLGCWCYETVHSGQAQAWLHTLDLSSDGYIVPDAKNYVFIGWSGPAPFLSYDIDDDDDVGYRFVGNFFAKLYGYYTGSADNVNDALDYASYKATGTSFGFSYLYNGFDFDSEATRIRVYGDGSYDLW